MEDEPRMTRKEHWEAINKERAEKKALQEKSGKVVPKKGKSTPPKTGPFGTSFFKKK